MKLVITEDKTKIILKEATREEYHQLKLHLNRKVDKYYFKKRCYKIKTQLYGRINRKAKKRNY